jgi:hypothetical protein
VNLASIYPKESPWDIVGDHFQSILDNVRFSRTRRIGRSLRALCILLVPEEAVIVVAVLLGTEETMIWSHSRGA